MTRSIFVNLPVSDLPRSRAFYLALGTTLDARFSNDLAACVVFSDTIAAMLLTHDVYRGFIARPIADAKATSQVLLCLAQETREAVDVMVEAATAAGGIADPSPRQDHGFMYGRSFEDPDGHVWEVMWMDPSGMPQAA